VSESQRCSYDTGSMYGCQPACDKAATTVVTYRNGSSGPLRAAVCDRHTGPMQGRAYPGVISVERLTAR